MTSQPSAEDKTEPPLSELEAAREEVRRARRALRAAEESCAEIERGSARPGCAKRLGGEMPLFRILDEALGLVKKHPGLGVAAAAAAGFMLGRILKRW